MAQAFLEAGEGREFVAGLDVDHPIHGQPCRLQPRRKQILLAHAPEDLSLQPRHDPSRKQRRSGTIQCPIPPAGNFMQSAQRQAAARQTRVDLLKPEGQNASHAAVRRLDPADFFTQVIDGGRGSHWGKYPSEID